MRRERRACRAAKAGDDVEYAGRNARFQRQFGNADRRQRGIFSRFDHQRVAHGQCRTRHAGKDLQRIVPRNDSGHDAMRFAQRQRRIAVEKWNRVAMHLVGCTAVKLVAAHGCDNVHFSLSRGFARVARFQRREFIGVPLDQMIQPCEAAPSFRCGHLRPWPLVECLARGVHGAVHVRFARCWN